MELAQIMNKKEDKKVIIRQAAFAESPLDIGENLGVMYCWHGKYNLGDEVAYKPDPEDYTSFDEMIENEFSSSDVILPLYLYDHSGICMATVPFGSGWDSGQVGFIVMASDKVANFFGGDVAKAKECLVDEVEEYSLYLQGDTYEYTYEVLSGGDWMPVGGGGYIAGAWQVVVDEAVAGLGDVEVIHE